MSLRPYQTKLLNNCRSEYGEGKRFVLMQLETGGGKTRIMATAADGVSRKGKTAGILMHRQELILQTSLTLADQKIYHGMHAPQDVMREAIKAQVEEYGRSYFNNDAPVKICSVQTLVRREYTPFDFLFMDECHRSVGETWTRIIKAHPKAWGLGVTATPLRLDGKGLGREFGGHFDSMVQGPTMAELVADGYLCHAEYWGAPRQLDFSEVKTDRNGEFDNNAAAGVVNKPTITGDAIAHYSRIAPHQPAIVFCHNIEHAQDVAAAFRAAGYRAACIDSTMHDGQRRAAIRGLADGRVEVLTSCEIVNEGTDIPVVTVAILLRRTNSFGMHRQQIGRVLRPVYAPGFDLSTTDGRLQAIAMSRKPHAIILDHVGNCDDARHGFADDPVEWSLEGRKKRSKRDAEPVQRARRCTKCYAIYRAQLSACPACGAPAELTRREIQQVEGELVRLQRDEAERAKRDAYWQQRRAMAEAKSHEDLVKQFMAQGASYGKATARARYIIAARESKANATQPKLIT